MLADLIDPGDYANPEAGITAFDAERLIGAAADLVAARLTTARYETTPEGDPAPGSLAERLIKAAIHMQVTGWIRDEIRPWAIHAEQTVASKRLGPAQVTYQANQAAAQARHRSATSLHEAALATLRPILAQPAY